MAKALLLTEEIKMALREEFEKSLGVSSRLSGVFSFQKTLSYPKQAHASLWYTALAWEKQKALISEFDGEIGWHALITKDPETETNYTVEDIIVYPQNVGQSTIDMDVEKYANWVHTIDNDSYNKMRFHGHSHVNMACLPSKTDLDHQEEILSGIPNSDHNRFYIFSIANKKGENNVVIYDFEDNMFFESNEIDICCEGINMTEFISSSKKMAPKITYSSSGTDGKTGFNKSVPAYDWRDRWDSWDSKGAKGSKSKNTAKNSGTGGNIRYLTDGADDFYSESPSMYDESGYCRGRLQ
jgi:hypothetical protein